MPFTKDNSGGSIHKTDKDSFLFRVAGCLRFCSVFSMLFLVFFKTF